MSVANMSQGNIKWQRQLILAVALFALGTFAYWLEYKHEPSKEDQETKAKKIFQIKETQIAGVRLFNGARTYSVNCMDLGGKLCKPGDNSKWELTEPLKQRADDGNVNALLSTLNNLQTMDTIDLKDETPEKRSALLREYGLDSSALRSDKKVEVTTPSGTTVLYLGQPHPIGESTFGVVEKTSKDEKPVGKVDDNRVYLVPNYLKTSLDRDLSYWRDKRLMTLASYEVSEFQLKGNGSTISGAKRDGKWTLNSQKQEYPGDTENIDSLLNAVAYLSARDFASDQKQDAKAKSTLRGAKQVLSLTVQKDKSDPISLVFYQKQGDPKAKTKFPFKLFAIVSNLDPLYEVEPGAKERLDKQLKDLRLSKLITTMERFSARRLEVSGKPLGDKPLVFTQKDGKWKNENNQDAGYERIQNLFDKLTGNRIKEFVEGSKIPAGEDDGIKISLGDGQTESKRLLFWKKDGKLYGKDLQSKRKEAFIIDNPVQDALPWSKDFFKASESSSNSGSKSKK